MLRRGFIQSILGLVCLGSEPTARGAPAMRRKLLLQTSSLAGFQFHDGPVLWPALRVGQPLDLVRERENTYDTKAVRVDWLGHKLGYVPRIENHVVAGLLDRGEKLSARIIALNERRDARRWEWDWERMRFEVLLEA